MTALALLACRASADSLPIVNFAPAYSVTNNKQGDVAIGMRQIHLSLQENDDDHTSAVYVDFKFTNKAPTGYTFQRSSITDIWFDDGTYTDGVLAPVSNIDPLNPQIMDSDGALKGVDFTRGATPENPPGIQNVTPKFVVTFSSDSSSPVEHHGVDSESEWVAFRWRLRDGKTFQDAVHAVATGELRIAVKMQGYTSGGSEVFLFVPSPKPATAGLGLLAAVALIRPQTRRRPTLS